MKSEVFYKLIRIAVGTSDALLEAVLSPSDWETVVDLADKHSVIGVLLSAVEKLPAAQRPPLSIGYQWLGTQSQIAMSNERQLMRISEIRGMFAEAGFRSCVLKGQAVAALYPEPKLRQCGDVDLWVEGGFRKVLGFVNSKWPVSSVVYHHCDAKIFEETETEIHFTPTWFFDPFRNRKLQRYFAENADRQFSGGLTNDFNLVYSMVHIFRHVLTEGVGLKQMMDYFYILKASSLEERTIALVALSRLGMARFTAAVMYVMKSVFALHDELLLCPVDARFGSKLLREIELTGNFGSADQRDENMVVKLFRFGAMCPSEALFAYPFRAGQFLWRLCNGYLNK